MRADLKAVRQFTDREIGAGYYSQSELEDIYQRSAKNGVMCSLVLEDDAKRIQGIRISYPPGQWEHGKGVGLAPHQWPHPLAATGYFQSLFLASTLRGEGWGGRLSERALIELRQVGAKGVVCQATLRLHSR